MPRVGGSYRLYRGEDCLTSALIDFSGPVTAAEAAKTAATILRGEPFNKTPAELEGCVLVVTGPFGLAKYDVVVDEGQTKLRRSA